MRNVMLIIAGLVLMLVSIVTLAVIFTHADTDWHQPMVSRTATPSPPF